ncbi:hypothetical protein [uncultured Ruegeria sp.]|uniref:hypothetical protein n=1 Tax=uncultured Ruegeria sp. TaxID=259304 RepID=UPI0026241099|nr:hypothetical protein [uncultured Ruegeria sp.]
MTPEVEQGVRQALELKARAGNVDAAKLLFAERSKQVRPVKFDGCPNVDELQKRFGEYMGQESLTAAEADAASKAFDRLFKTIVARDRLAKEQVANTSRTSGLMMVPVMNVETWESEAVRSQAALKQHARA